MSKKNNNLHVAIIMDGNGRWATEQGLKRIDGHKAGAQALHRLLEDLPSKVKYLTVYAFSTENWHRSIREVFQLLHLANDYLQTHLETFKKNNIRVKFIGNLQLLPSFLLNTVKKVSVETEKCSGVMLSVALSYGSRSEIITAFKAFQTKVMEQRSDLWTNVELTEETFNNFLYTRDIPDPDILIRTGGDRRLSNYLLWQIAYTEIFFLDSKWPDFTIDTLEQVLDAYGNRERRLGRDVI